MCREDKMDWFNFWRMALLITLNRRLIQSDNTPKTIRRMYRSFSKDSDVPFLKVLYEARSHQAADPRDKVFALLSHPSAQNVLRKRTIAQADHTKPILEVYQELAEEPLRTPGHHLELLSAVEHAPHVDFDLFDGFPSWVPRWGFGGQSTVLGGPGFSHFRTAISKEPKITISE